MKKSVAILLIICCLFTLAACGKKEAANRLEEIKERGYIEIVCEPYFAPFEFIDASLEGDAQYVGVDIEIAKFIADELGVELRIVPLEFSAVLAGVTQGKYDLAISALAYSPTRAESMEMSVGYYFSEDSEGYGLLVREEDLDKYQTAADLANAVIVTQSGSVQEGFVNDQIPEYAEFKRVSSMTDGFLMVAEGKADACACDIANGRLYAEANGGLVIATGFRFTTDESTEGTRAAAPKGETELIEFVNECIAKLRESGQIEEWYEYYADYARSLGIE